MFALNSCQVISFVFSVCSITVLPLEIWFEKFLIADPSHKRTVICGECFYVWWRRHTPLMRVGTTIHAQYWLIVLLSLSPNLVFLWLIHTIENTNQFLDTNCGSVTLFIQKYTRLGRSMVCIQKNTEIRRHFIFSSKGVNGIFRLIIIVNKLCDFDFLVQYRIDWNWCSRTNILEVAYEIRIRTRRYARKNSQEQNTQALWFPSRHANVTVTFTVISLCTESALPTPHV